MKRPETIERQLDAPILQRVPFAPDALSSKHKAYLHDRITVMSMMKAGAMLARLDARVILAVRPDTAFMDRMYYVTADGADAVPLPRVTPVTVSRASGAANR